MKGLLLLVVALAIPSAVAAQGVRDPSTPNSVIIVNPPQQPARPTATPNVPTAIPSPPLGLRRARPYHNGAHGSSAR